jgi:hypothetical protein
LTLLEVIDPLVSFQALLSKLFKAGVSYLTVCGHCGVVCFRLCETRYVLQLNGIRVIRIAIGLLLDIDCGCISEEGTTSEGRTHVGKEKTASRWWQREDTIHNSAAKLQQNTEGTIVLSWLRTDFASRFLWRPLLTPINQYPAPEDCITLFSSRELVLVPAEVNVQEVHLEKVAEGRSCQSWMSSKYLPDLVQAVRGTLEYELQKHANNPSSW